MLPPVAILAAVGTTEILSAVPSWISTPMLTAAILALACALAGETVHRYFFQWAQDSRTPEYFDGNNALLAGQLNSVPANQRKVVAIYGPSEAADPFFLPLISLRFLTRSVTSKQEAESNIRYYTPSTFPAPLPADLTAGDFCAKVKVAMPEAVVVCPGI